MSALPMVRSCLVVFGRDGARSVVRAIVSVAAAAGAVAWCRSDAYCATASEPAAGAIARIGTDALATGVAPGLSIAVVHHGQIVAEQGFGVADTATNTAVTPATRFAIGSLSKQFTAAAVLVLAQTGKLSLDDTLHTYEPALPNASQITLRMLLAQTSGLHSYPRMSEHPWPTSGTIATSQIIAMLARDRPDFAPGSKWEYSNANYAALTAIVERASGSSYADYLRRTIFKPLGMTHSDYGTRAQASEPVAMSYVKNEAVTPPLALDLFGGAGGVVSSAHDLAQWDTALLAASGGASNATQLDRADVTTMWTPGRLSNGTPVAYAMGWIPDAVGGHRELWHNGLAPGAGGYCFNAIFPDHDLAVVVLTNGSGAAGLPERIVREIAALYHIAPAASPVPAVSPATSSPSDVAARAFWDALGNGTVDRSRLTAAFSEALTPAYLQTVAQQIAAFGPLRAFTPIDRQSTAGISTYRYRLEFASGADHEWTITFAPDGKIAGSRLLR